MNVRQILARRDEIRVELRGICEKHSDGALPDDVRQRADELEEEANRLNDLERRQVLLDELDRRAAGQPLGGGGADAGFEALASQVTILDAIRAGMGATDAGAGRAREVSAEIERRSGRKAEGIFFDMRASGARRTEQRVFTTTLPAGGPGSNLIATDVGPLIDILRARLIVRRLGATILNDLQGNLSLPRLKQSATAYWVAENSPITISDVATESVGPLVPRHVGALVEVSRNMLQQPSVDVVQLVENDCAAVIARALDSVALVGGGTNQPKGLLAAGSGITIVPTSGTVTWAAVMALIEAVDVANALEGSLAFATNGKAMAQLRTTLKSTADTSSNFIIGDAGNTLAGYPIVSSQLIPSNLTSTHSALIFGDWSQLVVGFWSALDLLVNPYESVAYSKGNVQIRAMATADVAIKQPLAFAASTDITATMAAAAAPALPHRPKAPAA